MVVVAIAAVSLGFWDLLRRVRSYRLQAWYHLAASRQLANDCQSFICFFGTPSKQVEALRARLKAERGVLRAASEYHLRLHAKYAQAAARPWLPVCPDASPPPASNPILASSEDY
jgi:hypothetical protein